MPRILLLIQHAQNHRLLSEFLARDYEVVAPPNLQRSSATEASATEAPMLDCRDFDLCLVDNASLNKFLPWLVNQRTAIAPQWFPVLLVVPKDKIAQVTHLCWQQVDEMIAMPVEKAELMTRIGVLLRVRQLSQDLWQANQALQVRNEELQELNRLKSQFVSMVSHEFQNPLGTVSGFLQLLQRQGDGLSVQKRQTYLQKAQSILSHLNALVNDVLILGRVGVGKLKFAPVTTNLALLCQALVEEIRFNAPSPCNLTIAITTEAQSTLLAVSIDATLLRQVLTNLVTNALKYSPEGSPVQVSLDCDRGDVLLTIQDQGIGIPIEEQAQLFEPFYRASNVGNLPGTGLGLAIAQQCAELHGGSITFTSKVGKGTTFKVRIPWMS